jgi:hypothetical protein
MATEALKDEDGLPILKPRTPDYMRKAKTYTDYPEAAVNNAKRALKWVEANGWGNVERLLARQEQIS